MDDAIGKVLVTGAAGLSGAALVRELARHENPVRALVRDRSKATGLLALPGVEVVEGDLLRPETLDVALDGVDRAVLISSATAEMVEAQCSFIGAARRAGLRHVLKFSGKESNIGFDQSRFRFGKMHADIEHLLEDSGLEWTHVRPSQFMQVYLREVSTIAAKGALCLPLSAAVSLAPIDVDDVARVIVGLLRGGPTHVGKGYDLTGPEAITMDQIAARISSAVGTPVRYVSISIEERRRAGLAKGMSQFFADALDEQARERLRCPQAGIDTGIAESLGVSLTTFAQFARRHADEFRGAVK